MRKYIKYLLFLILFFPMFVNGQGAKKDSSGTDESMTRYSFPDANPTSSFLAQTAFNTPAKKIILSNAFIALFDNISYGINKRISLSVGNNVSSLYLSPKISFNPIKYLHFGLSYFYYYAPKRDRGDENMSTKYFYCIGNSLLLTTSIGNFDYNINGGLGISYYSKKYVTTYFKPYSYWIGNNKKVNFEIGDYLYNESMSNYYFFFSSSLRLFKYLGIFGEYYHNYKWRDKKYDYFEDDFFLLSYWYEASFGISIYFKKAKLDLFIPSIYQGPSDAEFYLPFYKFSLKI